MQHGQQQEEGSHGGGKAGAGFLCRQSSTRWIPTSDQIRILRDLYYNSGLRSPNADQIQRISARLRQYGKIEGKNVFYWFQNHKARERQKKRLTVDLATAAAAAAVAADTCTKTSTAARIIVVDLSFRFADRGSCLPRVVQVFLTGWVASPGRARATAVSMLPCSPSRTSK